MCARIGCTHFPKLQDMDFSGAAVASRRQFLKGAAAPSTISVGMAMGMGVGSAFGAAGIKSTHGSGFCNLNIFLAHSRQYSKAAGTELIFINTPTSAEMVTFLGMGQVDIGLMPYTSFIALYHKGAPVKIVAGGGGRRGAPLPRPALRPAPQPPG